MAVVMEMRKENQKYKVEREEADRVMNEALEKVRKDLTESKARELGWSCNQGKRWKKLRWERILLTRKMI